jgi:hypothetical protein
MAAPILPDAGSVNASNVLESLFNAADVGVDVWKKWTQAKTENLATKAALPSIAQPGSVQANGIGGMSPAVLIGGGLVVVALVVVLTRK